MTTHPSDTDLERYCLGMIQEGPELDALEEHLLIASEAYIDRIRASLVKRGVGRRSLAWQQGGPTTKQRD
jgi:hypothetical protein